MAALDPAYRQTYTPDQVQLYYERIQLPPSYRDVPVQSIAGTQAGLVFLTVLQKHQLAAIPFENLDLHYSSHHIVDIDPQQVFHKIVERNAGRGGYCMQNNCLFGTLLRSLGFDVYSTGAKVSDAIQPVAASSGWKGPKYDGWGHMVNLVTIEGQKYLVDVGFGSSGPTHPLPLVQDQVVTNVGSQEMHLLRTPIPDLTDARQRLWCYQHRNAADLPWIPTYCFSELEFTPDDFLIMNHFTSTHRTSWFTYKVVCVKMIMKDGQIVGDVTLFENEVKRRLLGTSEPLATCSSELERVEALDEFLGVKLTDAEKDGIHGMVTELL